MAIILPYKGTMPKIGKNVFLAENTVIIGDVEIGLGLFVFFQFCSQFIHLLNGFSAFSTFMPDGDFAFKKCLGSKVHIFEEVTCPDVEFSHHA